MKTFGEDHADLTGMRWAFIVPEIRYILANHRPPQPMAVCIDIDGTIISDHPALRHKLYPNVISTLDQLVKEFSLSIFIITARPESNRSATTQQLQKLGVWKYLTRLYMWELSETNDVADYKATQRAHIRDSGFHILAAVGDQKQDLTYHDQNSQDQEPVLNILIENPFVSFW